MKTLPIFLLLVGILVAFDIQASDTLAMERFSIGISSNTFTNIEPNDFSAALKSWALIVGKEQGLQLQAQAEVFEVNDSLRTSNRLERMDAFSLTVGDFMFLNLKPDAVFVPFQDHGIYINYVIIVHHDSDISDMGELAGRKVILHRGNRMVLALPWMEYILAGHAKGSIRNWLGDLTFIENPSKGILQVFFRQAHAALVTKTAFELACELNPQLKKHLKVLSVSPSFLPSFLVFQPSTPGSVRHKMKSGIIKLHNTPQGRQILSIYQSPRMEKHPVSILDGTRQFLMDYDRLVQKGEDP